MFRPVLVTPPDAAVLLVTLAEAKAHLRVDSTNDDALITTLIASATTYLDGYAGILGRCLIQQTWSQAFEWFGRCMELPFPDVSAVTLKYYDAVNAQQTVSAANYQLLERDDASFVDLVATYVPPTPYLFREDRVLVTMTVGYGTAAATVPQAIKQAMLLLIGDWYQSRETMQEGRLAQLPFSVDALLGPFKRKSF
jgi:uncharacterized phiE125 gp8 family phage protein